MIPVYPPNVITRPFANNGNAIIIPDAKPADGRASWQEGFPVETQSPLSNGGIAPNRIDFNGIFQMLSALAFWQQSGGQMVYSTALNYQTPCIVYFDGRLWWCVRMNGPDVTDPGVVQPGTDKDTWLDLYTFLSGQSAGGGGGVTASGYMTEFRSFYEQNAPVGWAIRNGALLSNADTVYPDLWAALQLSANSWKLKTQAQWAALQTAAGGTGGAPFFVLDTTARTIRLPDTRGDYERCAGGGTMANVGQWHGDAIRNITGKHYFGQDANALPGAIKQPTGAFKYGALWHETVNGLSWGNGGSADIWYELLLDASLLVPIADENRTRAFGVLGCVYTGVAVS
jgi:hypothetical protein